MRKYVIVLLIGLSINAVIGQTKSNGKWMSKADVKTFFTPELKEEIGMQLPIFKVREFSDNNGDNMFVFTEELSMVSGKDTLHNKIKGHFIQKKKGEGWKQVLDVKDFLDEDEESIWFWTKYSVFEDIDKDGIMDPIIVYGSRHSDTYLMEGRLKIMVIYKGKKVFIRHENAILDQDRVTQVDKAFYELPKSIQNRVRVIIKRIQSNDLGVFSYSLFEEMNMKKTRITEEGDGNLG